MEQKLDLLLFGATGLVGRNGVEHLHKLTKDLSNITWGVAGRNYKKIKKILLDLEKSTGDPTISSRIPIISADMSDEESISVMTSRTKVLINACGPLYAVGEVVIKSCIQSKTHYVDVSAEDMFMYKILLDYDKQAKEAGIYIVNACGLNCLFFDMGVLYLQRQFPGTMNSVEVNLKTGSNNPNLKGPTGNKSTWYSTIDVACLRKKLNELKSMLKIENPPLLGPKLSRRILPFRPNDEQGWAIALTTTDRPTMLRTQQYLYEEKSTYPAQIETYIVFDKLWHVFGLILILIVFMSLVFFKAGRWLLRKYPHIFSAGYFGYTEPTREKCKNLWVRLTCIGKGWKGRKLNSYERTSESMNYSMTLQIKGNDPGYGLSALCLVSAGLMIATEPWNIPEKYGVLTPGVAFGNTSLIDVLKQNGISFEIINEHDIS